MGKRSLHDVHFFQCAWTGYPMRNNDCYFPTWNLNKLGKRGTYCNWESVLAHAHYLHNTDSSDFDASMLLKIENHIDSVAGYPVHVAPSYTELSHIKDGGMKMDEFHAICSKQNKVHGVSIDIDGNAKNVSEDEARFNEFYCEEVVLDVESFIRQ